jgi:predicted Co/Zn/Cd cation transporter (cation efflux family)
VFFRADALPAAAMLALSHALLAAAALRAQPSSGPETLAALGLARGGMLAVIVAWLAVDAWPVLAGVIADSGTAAPTRTDFRDSALFALGAAALAVGAAAWTAARAQRAVDAADGQLMATLTGQWRLQALVFVAVALCQGAGWHLQRAGADGWLGVAGAAALLLPWLLLLPPTWQALNRWPAAGTGNTMPRRLRTDTERVVADVLKDLPLAGYHLGVRWLRGRPHVHLVGLVDDLTDLDAEAQDVLRARVYERLRGAYPDLALDVHFTRDAVWAARGLCGMEQAAA